MIMIDDYWDYDDDWDDGTNIQRQYFSSSFLYNVFFIFKSFILTYGCYQMISDPMNNDHSCSD